MESEIESFKKFVTCNIENLIKILHNNLRYIIVGAEAQNSCVLGLGLVRAQIDKC